jgi:hypothetical protein
LPPLPRAETAYGVALVLLLEAVIHLIFGLRGWPTIMDAPANIGIGPVFGFALTALLIPPVMLLAGAIGLVVRWRPGWWAALGMEWVLLLASFSGLAHALELVGRPTDVAPIGNGVIAGFVLLFFSNLGWHLMMILLLTRADVRARLHLESVDRWSASARSAAIGATVFCAFLGIRIGLGY